MKRENVEAAKETVRSETTEEYIRYTRKRILFVVALALILVVVSLITLTLGSTDLSLGDIWNILLHPDDSWNSTVIWDSRLPKIAAGILAGFALGIAGAVMQGILRNPMASPFTLGISNASAFGAALGIMILTGGVVVGSSTALSNPLIVTVMAFIFAMIATGIVIALVKITDSSPETIVLAGLAISSIFSAGLAFLQFIANDVALSSIVFWQFGSLDKVSWNDLGMIAVILFVSVLYFIFKRWDYNSMDAGEDVARGLGVKIQSTRMIGLTVSAILTAVVVSFMGVIGFIGLIGPHIVKRLIGNDNRYLLIGSMLVGAIVLLVANMFGNYAFDVVIPVGIITSAIGGPLFILILLRGYRKRC